MGLTCAYAPLGTRGRTVHSRYLLAALVLVSMEGGATIGWMVHTHVSVPGSIMEKTVSFPSSHETCVHLTPVHLPVTVPTGGTRTHAPVTLPPLVTAALWVLLLLPVPPTLVCTAARASTLQTHPTLALALQGSPAPTVRLT